MIPNGLSHFLLRQRQVGVVKADLRVINLIPSYSLVDIQGIVNCPNRKVIPTSRKSATFTIKARTHRPIFRGSAAELVVESADSNPESADSTTDSVIVGRLSLSNMFDILNSLDY